MKSILCKEKQKNGETFPFYIEIFEDYSKLNAHFKKIKDDSELPYLTSRFYENYILLTEKEDLICDNYYKKYNK
jgi:hypothetical protein